MYWESLVFQPMLKQSLVSTIFVVTGFEGKQGKQGKSLFFIKNYVPSREF